MKIYIAGKITGLDPEDALAEFERAENLVLIAGHTPLNPMRLVEQAEGREYGEQLADALTILLTQAEAVFFLPDWRDSRGATIERFIAKTLNIPMYFAADAIPLNR